MALAQERNVLLENVDALMKKRWGKVIKTRLSEKAKVGQGTHDRIIEGTSIGLEVLFKISEALGVVGQTVAGLMSSTLQAQYGKPPLSG